MMVPEPTRDRQRASRAIVRDHLWLGTAAAVGLWEGARLLAERRRAASVWAFAALVALVTGTLATATLARNETWRDDYALWRDATVKAPRNPRAWLNAGHAAMERGTLDEARDLLLEAHRLSPCYAYVQMNLSALATRTGDRDASLQWADEGVRCNPGLSLTHRYRAVALERLGRVDDALAAFARASAIDPHDADAWRAQGRLLEARAVWTDAAAAYDRVLDANPLDAETAMRAGLLYQYRLGDPARAVLRYRVVLRLNPTHYGGHYQIATALLAAGRSGEAHAAWEGFVRLAEAIGDRRSIDGAPVALRSIEGNSKRLSAQPG